MIQRSLLFFSLFTALFMLSPLAAQDVDQGTYCGDLADDDCQMLRDASIPTTSGSFITQFYVASSNPDLPETSADVAFAMTIEGDFSHDEGGQDAIGTNSAFGSLQALNFRGTVSALGAAHNDTDVADMGPEMTPEPMVEATADATLESDDAPMREIFYADVALADGMLYVNGDTLRLSAQDDMTGNDATADDAAWISTSVLGLFAAHLNQQSSGLDTGMVTAYQSGIGMRSRFNQLEFADYVDVMMLEPEDEALVEMFGQNVAVYTTTFDVGGFLSDPTNRALITDQMASDAMSSEGAASTPEMQSRFDQDLNAMNEGSVRYVEYVGLDDNRIHRIELIVNNITVENENGETRRVDLVLVSDYSDLDAVEVEAAPDNAMMVEPQTFYDQARAALTASVSEDMSGFGSLTSETMTDTEEATLPDFSEATAEAMTDDMATPTAEADSEADVTAEADSDLLVEPTADPNATIVPLVLEDEAVDLESDLEMTPEVNAGG